MTDFCGRLYTNLEINMIRIGTRGSRLALWQANHLKKKLQEVGIKSELVIIKTKGDRIQDLSFDKIEGKGFFTKEIEEALISEEIDVAVHSLKDLPTEMLEGLVLAGLSERADPRDMLIIHPDFVDEQRPLKMSENCVVGTSSIRRKVQLKALDQKVEIQDIRGNVPTRVQKVADKVVGAIVIAAAGVDRLDLDLSAFKVIRLNPNEFVPAPAQGVNAYQCRSSDKITKSIIQDIHQKKIARCTNVERTAMKLLDGGCQLPLGVYCYQDENQYFHCNAILGTSNTIELKKAQISSSTTSGIAEKIVSQLLSD